jgi:ferritin-like metal-binding protein YciE
MSVDSLRIHLIDELSDLLDAENQLTKALPKMAKAASAPVLRTAFQKHLQETHGHIERLTQALGFLWEKPARKTCEGMQGLLAEGDEVMSAAPAGALRDAMMITAAQKVEHYEIGTYGTVRTYAQVLGEPRVAKLLERTLKEEKAADGKLTVIAERSVNEDAAEEWRANEGEGVVERSTAWMGQQIQSAAAGARRVARSVGIAQDRTAQRRASKTAKRNGGGRTRARRQAGKKR